MEDNQAKRNISLRKASTAQEQLSAEAGQSPINTPLKVLIVDDNQVNLMVAERLLQKMDCTVYTAGSGREGIEKLRELPIQCVFMDCQMPELSGFETTQLIRQGEAGSDKAGVFISALTAYTDDSNKILCYESGMDHFIAKPLRKVSFTKALDVLRTGRNPNLSGYREFGTSCLILPAI